MFIINSGLADNQLAHIKNCKGPAEAWNTHCNIHKLKSLFNIFYSTKVVHVLHDNKMQEDDHLLDYINKVKALANHLACLKIPVRDEYIIMTPLESLSASNEYSIIALDTMPIKWTYNGLHDDVLDAWAMKTQRKEKNPQGENIVKAEGLVFIMANHVTLYNML